MSFFKSFNRNNGATYVYEVTGYKYDSKRTVPVRRLYGKIDPVTGQTVPTRRRGRPRKEESSEPAGSSVMNVSSVPAGLPAVSSDSSNLQSLYESARMEIARKNQRISELKSALQSALILIQSISSSVSDLDTAASRIEEALKVGE